VLSAATDRGGSTWTQTYAYTEPGGGSVNRLTAAWETGPGSPSWYETYGYDAFGNRWLSGNSGLWGGAVTNETPLSGAWYNTATNRISNGGTWSYDNAGNITAVGGTSRSFQYDAENRQTQAVVNGVTENYFYDGESRRVAKANGTGTTTYIYDADGQLAMEFPTGSPAIGTAYLTADMLGSTRLITDGTGNTTECQDYLPFGQQIQAGVDGRSAVCFGVANTLPEKTFTGKERDVNTGLDYFGARYMSSAQGRFTSPDEFPGGIVDPFTGQQVQQPKPLPYADTRYPQSLNKYAYVVNNPLRWTDPDGHCAEVLSCTVEFAGGGGLIGGPPGAVIGGIIGAGVGGAIVYFGAKAIISHMDDEQAKKDTPPGPLPANPDALKEEGYHDTSHPEASAAGHRTFENPQTGDKVRFDQGKPGAPGHEGTDHYHRYNPKATGKGDQYLDATGKPVPRGSDASHLKPQPPPPPKPKPEPE
jgi:RHS repeat-associated protein